MGRPGAGRRRGVCTGSNGKRTAAVGAHPPARCEPRRHEPGTQPSSTGHATMRLLHAGRPWGERLRRPPSRALHPPSHRGGTEAGNPRQGVGLSASSWLGSGDEAVKPLSEGCRANMYEGRFSTPEVSYGLALSPAASLRPIAARTCAAGYNYLFDTTCRRHTCSRLYLQRWRSHCFSPSRFSRHQAARKWTPPTCNPSPHRRPKPLVPLSPRKEGSWLSASS